MSQRPDPHGFTITSDDTYDNACDTIENDCRRIDVLLKKYVSEEACVVHSENTPECDYFVLHSCTLPHKKQITTRVADELCPVQYEVEEGEWETEEGEMHGTTTFTMPRVRRTLRIRRDAYMSFSLWAYAKRVGSLWLLLFCIAVLYVLYTMHAHI